MNSTGFPGQGLAGTLDRFRLRRGIAFGVIIIAALCAFEIFNYSTTDYALGDLLGGLTFLGVRWSTILAIAFCGIDFAGIARLFTPEDGSELTEVWYLFGAWLLAATMNAMLTWWGVSIAILQHDSLGSSVVARESMLRVVPIFVAVMVWLIRVLIIGTFSVAGPRLFSQAEQGIGTRRSRQAYAGRSIAERAMNERPVERPALSQPQAAQRPVASPPASAPAFRPAPKTPAQPEPNYSRPEPTYHPVSMSPKSNGSGPQRVRQ